MAERLNTHIDDGLPHPAGFADGPSPGEASRRYRRVAIMIAWSDGLAAVFGALVSLVIVRGSEWAAVRSWYLVGLSPLVVILVFGAYGLYRIQGISPAQEFRLLFGAVSVGVIVLALLANLLSRLMPGREGTIPLTVGWLIASWLCFLLLVMLERKRWHTVISRRRGSGELAYRTVVVGDPAEANELARRLRPPGLGFRTVGFVAMDPSGTSDPPSEDLPVLGSVGDLARVIRAERIDCVFVGASGFPVGVTADVLKTARRAGVQVRVAANMPEMLSSRLSVQAIGGRLTFAVANPGLSGMQVVMKRAFDLAVAGLGLVISSPVWLVAAVLVKTTSKGPVLFRQQRVGRGGRPFSILKFRTMTVDAEARKEALKEWSSGPLFKLANDPRRTRVGRVLRRYSIDELPQLVNVLKGDMSLVGPRPLVMFDRSEIEEWHLSRLEALPGMTGLWQVSGRSELTFDECVQLDSFYIENWSIAYDLYILLKTVPAVLRRRGAF